MLFERRWARKQKIIQWWSTWLGRNTVLSRCCYSWRWIDWWQSVPRVFLVMVVGGNECSSDWDRNIIPPNCCLTLIRSLMYWGASPWIALNAKISNLNSILKQTGNQCKENKVGVIWQKRERKQTSRPALFQNTVKNYFVTFDRQHILAPLKGQWPSSGLQVS